MACVHCVYEPLQPGIKRQTSNFPLNSWLTRATAVLMPATMVSVLCILKVVSAVASEYTEDIKNVCRAKKNELTAHTYVLKMINDNSNEISKTWLKLICIKKKTETKSKAGAKMNEYPVICILKSIQHLFPCPQMHWVYYQVSSIYLIGILRSNHNSGRLTITRKAIDTRCKCKGPLISCYYPDNAACCTLHVNIKWKWSLFAIQSVSVNW